MGDAKDSEIDVCSSGDEFPEITEDELQVWTRVERKRFHYRPCLPRDEELLNQVLSIRPFEAKTPKERLEKWNQVAQLCDSKTKDLFANSTRQLNFFFGAHAKKRFKVIMEAHHRLLTNSNNAIFASTYEGSESIRSLVEKAYRLYLFAGYHPGSSSKRPESKKRPSALHERSNEESISKRHCSDVKEMLKSMTTLVEMQESMAGKWLNEQQKYANELGNSSKRRMEEIVELHKETVKQLTGTIDDERKHVQEKLELHEERLYETFKNQETWMHNWTSAEQGRQKQWVDMYSSWVSMQHEMAEMQRKLVEMQDRAENNRMAFLRDMLKK